MRRRTSKGATEFALSWSSSGGQGIFSSEWFLFLVGLCWRQFFILQLLSIGDKFWVRDHGMCPFLPSGLRSHLLQTYASPVHSATVNELICVLVTLCLQELISLVSSIISVSCNLSTSFSTGLPEPWVEGFDREIPYRMERFKVSFSTHCSTVSICIFPHMLQEAASLVMSEKDTICAYNRVSFFMTTFL